MLFTVYRLLFHVLGCAHLLVVFFLKFIYLLCSVVIFIIFYLVYCYCKYLQHYVYFIIIIIIIIIIFVIEFAKEAMTCQTLDKDEILSIRWAHDDPNPVAQDSIDRANKDALVALMQAKG
jgi:hypothetical protein